MPNVLIIPPEDLTVPALRLTAKAGVPVLVPADIAGHAPDPRLEAAHLELRAAIEALDHNLAAALRDEILELDPGAGLLAQGWTLAPAAPADPAAPTAAPSTPRPPRRPRA